MTETLTESQLECRRLIAIFDRTCREAGFVVKEDRSDDAVMADVVKGQKGHPVTVDHLIASFTLTARKDKPASVSRLFAAVPVLVAREIEKRQLSIDPLVQSVLDGVPVAPFEAQRWFLEARYDEHGKLMRLVFPNEYCCKQAQVKFERGLYDVARRRGFLELRFEVAR